MNRIRSLLVHVDGAAGNIARLTLACDLAERHGAALTMLFAASPPLLDVPYAHVGGAIALDGLQELFGQRVHSARHMVQRVLAQRALDCTWQELSGVTPGDGFARQALFADLLVLGQHDPGDPSAQHVPSDFAYGVLLHSGKPALIVPSAGAHGGVGRKAVVAWKATRESARALTAALPLLREAEQVHVFTWGGGSATRAGRTPDVERLLRLHGIDPVLHHETRVPRELGETLLSCAADLGADLLVMGCYGHSRAREFVVGGVSRTVLASMTLPVLMCH
jgi:nucleotide-binding universal stress UspA family protein